MRVNYTHIKRRVNYTHIKRWNTFTNCECVGGDIV